MFSNRFSSKASVFAVSALSFGLSSPAAIAFTFNLQTATIADINRAFDLGGLNSVGLTQLYLARIAAYDTTLNSIITLNPNALTTAAGLDLERQTTGPVALSTGCRSCSKTISTPSICPLRRDSWAWPIRLLPTIPSSLGNYGKRGRLFLGKRV